MTLNNTVLYCKHWYKVSNTIWRDLARCLAVDYSITLSDKHEVASYLYHLLDTNINSYVTNNSHFGISYILNEIYNYLTVYKVVKDYDDAVIKFFIDETSMLSNNVFDEVYRPNEKVLPFNYSIMDETYEDFTHRIEKNFPDGIVQVIY